MDRKPNHDLRGRPYADSLAVRAEKAIGIVCRITSERRTTRLSIPAGDLLHAEPCGDEDMYLCDVLRDQEDEIKRLRSALDTAQPPAPTTKPSNTLASNGAPTPSDGDVAVAGPQTATDSKPRGGEALTHAERVEKDRPAYPSLYSAVWPDLVPLARSLGYALTIHGSLSRDLDLIAVPWTEEAVEPEALVKAVADKFGAWVGSPDLGPVTRKPHGRMGAIIVLGGHAVVDLSVMPRATPAAHPTPAPSAQRDKEPPVKPGLQL